MRIVSCHIENFGKLQDMSISFRENVQEFYEENGWGKSTLAAFLKVMFFGFADEGKRDELANERKRYKPWQGGVYGGSLVFSAHGKTYELTRTFGTKAKEDVFVLRDANTNLVSSDFSENIGEELFQIDRDSFCRTVYISQNDCETVSTDGIHAKIGNLAENTNDINNYETVRKRFTDRLNEMSPTRKTGSINRRMEQIYELETRVRRIPELDESIRLHSQKRDAQIARRDELKRVQEEIQEKLRKISAAKDIQTKQESYRKLCEQLFSAKLRFEQSRSYFSGRVPEEKEILSMNDTISRISKLQLQQAENRFSPEEEERLSSLDDLFSSGMPEGTQLDALVSLWSVRNEKKNVLNTKKATLSTLRSVADVPTQKEKVRNLPMLFVGIVLVLAGIALCVVNVALGAIAALLGIVLTVFGVTGRQSNQTSSGADAAKTDGLMRMEQEIREDEEFILNAEEKISAFLRNYHIECDDNEVVANLYRLKAQTEEYAVLSRRKEKSAESGAQEECEQLVNEASVFFSTFYPTVPAPEQWVEALQEIRTHLQSLYECRETYDELRLEKEKFESECDIEKLRSTEQVSDGAFETLNARLQEITDELEQVISHISDYRMRLDELGQERDDISEAEEHLLNLREEVETDTQQYTYLTKTRDYLEKAKERFTAKYRTPLRNSFEKYYGLLTRQTAAEYQIDANINLTATQQGIQRDVRLLSTGYRDLTGICMRMSLIDAMYQDEKPIIIFDDPFTNLDEEKTKGGIAFLREIAKEYQIIYFTCHESRHWS